MSPKRSRIPKELEDPEPLRILKEVRRQGPRSVLEDLVKGIEAGEIPGVDEIAYPFSWPVGADDVARLRQALQRHYAGSDGSVEQAYHLAQRTNVLLRDLVARCQVYIEHGCGSGWILWRLIELSECVPALTAAASRWRKETIGKGPPVRALGVTAVSGLQALAIYP